MKTYRLLALVLMAAVLAACSTTVGSGKVVTETRTVGEFASVSLRCSADVVIVQGTPQAVSIEGEDNIIPLVETNVSNKTLIVDFKMNSVISRHKDLVVHITVPNIDSVQTTGSGNIQMDQWSASNVELESTGSGDIHIGNIQADSLTSRQTGSGDITIDGGKTTNQKVTTSGSGAYNGAKLESSSTDAKSTGSGDITVWAVNNLTATTSGSGDIGYYGSPQVSEHSSGSGDVTRRGDKP